MNQETGCLPRLLRLLAIGVALVVVVTLPAALVAYDIGQVVFSKARMTQIVADQLAGSDEIRRLLVTDFLSNPAPGEVKPGDFSLVRAAQGLSPEQTQELTNLLLPQEWFRQQVESVVGGVYDWLDGTQPRPELTLDLRPLKERLLGGGAQQLMLLLIDSWPQCLSDQLAVIEQAIRTTRPPPILYCKPPGSLRGIYTDKSTIWFTSQVRAMPDTISLTGEKAAPSGGPDLSPLRDRIRLARDLLRYGWMLPASLFGLIMALAVRSWTGLARWWGGPLAGTGLASLLLIPLARPVETRLLREVRPAEALPPILMDTLRNAAGGIRSAVMQALAAQAILLVLLGAGLLLGGWLLGRRRPSEGSRPVYPPAQMEPAGATEASSDRPSGIFG